jgi:RES domain-containing protein
VTAQRLDRVLTAYRIGDPDGAHPIFDATGSRLYPGRWNTAASPMIYASEHYSTAMLEKLVRGSGRLPPNQHFIEITIPNGIAYEMVDSAHLPGWDEPACAVSKAFGAAWQGSKRALLLIVPSVVARMEHNFLLNPEHPEFPQATHGLHRPVWWDSRLFASGAAPTASAPTASAPGGLTTATP